MQDYDKFMSTLLLSSGLWIKCSYEVKWNCVVSNIDRCCACTVRMAEFESFSSFGSRRDAKKGNFFLASLKFLFSLRTHGVVHRVALFISSYIPLSLYFPFFSYANSFYAALDLGNIHWRWLGEERMRECGKSHNIF